MGLYKRTDPLVKSYKLIKEEQGDGQLLCQDETSFSTKEFNVQGLVRCLINIKHAYAVQLEIPCTSRSC